MTQEHLSLEELDLLIDEDDADPTASARARAHVAECAECVKRFEEEQFVVTALTSLPHLAPQYDFKNRVMTAVPVTVPWHVAAAESVHRFTPRSRGARAAALAVVTAAGAGTTAALVWGLSRPDVVLYLTRVANNRARTTAADAWRGALASMFGQSPTGPHVGNVAAVGVVMIAGAAVTLAGLRAAAGVSQRRRS